MADHRIETKILLRYATYSQWMNSELILLPGEAAIAVFPRTSTMLNTDDIPENTPPAIGIKIGDGESYFSELPWVQAIAADVYTWAKASQKPSYSANEIAGLTEFINAVGAGGSGSGSGSETASYRIIYDQVTSKYILQHYDESQQAWVNTTSEIDLSSILNRINTIERWANGARSNLGNIEVPIAEYVYEEVVNYVNNLDYNDIEQPHQFVTSVVQTNGKIAVTRSIISASDINGVLDTEHGGTGVSRVEEDELLIGSIDGSLRVRRFTTQINEDERQLFVTAGAVIDYVLSKTAGITGAMHFIGESSIPFTSQTIRIDPQIVGYNFRNAQPGDVILANNAQEYVWTGDQWRLLGDEGSYAVKGSIVNADISDDAAISQSKIDSLDTSFNNKVDKIEGKGLSTNDYTNEDKNKLFDIENNAQVNIIEHIIFNGDELNPTTINGQDKSIAINFNGMTQEQSDKLEAIEENAQVNVIEGITVDGDAVPVTNKIAAITIPESYQNVIEGIYINGEAQEPGNDKIIRLTLDEDALQIAVINGAMVPGATPTSPDEAVNINNKKLELARVAKTGNIDDLIQESTYIIFNGGSSSEVI